MQINYWNCEFNDYEEYWNEEEGDEFRVYGCTHPCNKSKYCDLDNKWGDDEADCSFLNSKDESST